MKQIGNYLLVEKKEILLKCSKQPLIPFRCSDDRLAEKIANWINSIYGTDLGYLGYVDWLSGIQQIHQDKSIRYKFGEFIDKLSKLNREIGYSDIGLKSPEILKEELWHSANEILTKYLKK